MIHGLEVYVQPECLKCAFLAMALSPFNKPREQQRANTGEEGREDGNVLPDLHFLGPLCLRGVAEPPYMEGTCTWDLHETDFDGISLQAKALEQNMYTHSQLAIAWLTGKSFRSEKGVIFLILAPQGVSLSGFVEECGTTKTSLMHTPNVL